MRTENSHRPTERPTTHQSHQCVTTLTGQSVLLSNADAARYLDHLQSFSSEWAPAGARETGLVQSIADAGWRIDHVTGMENALWAKERTFFTNSLLDEPEDVRAQLIDLEIFQINERQFRSLQKEETRLRRQRDRDIAELRRLQAERKEAAELEKALVIHAYLKAKKEEKPFDPAANGFVFSTAEIERFVARREAQKAVKQEMASFLRRRPVA